MPTLMDRASRLRRLIHSVSSGLRWLPPTVARLTVGWVFLQSGWGKLQNLPKVVAFFTELGIPAPQFQAPLAATAEFACGALLLAGLFTRVATLPLIATMVVAILTAKKADIHELSDLFGMAEYLYIALLLWLGAYGAGPISLDAVFARRLDSMERPVPEALTDPKIFRKSCGGRPERAAVSRAVPPASSKRPNRRTARARPFLAFARESRERGPLVAARAHSVPAFAFVRGFRRAEWSVHESGFRRADRARGARAVRILPRLVLAHRALGPRRPVFLAWHSRCSPGRTRRHPRAA